MLEVLLANGDRAEELLPHVGQYAGEVLCADVLALAFCVPQVAHEKESAVRPLYVVNVFVVLFFAALPLHVGQAVADERAGDAVELYPAIDEIAMSFLLHTLSSSSIEKTRGWSLRNRYVSFYTDFSSNTDCIGYAQGYPLNCAPSQTKIKLVPFRKAWSRIQYERFRVLL